MYHNFVYQLEYVYCADDKFVTGHKKNLLSNVYYSDYWTPQNSSTVSPPRPSDVEFHKYWDIQKTVPFFLLVVLLPLINFKSPTFFTKFNALGESDFTGNGHL